MKCSRVTLFFDRMYKEGDTFDHPAVTAHMGSCPECAKNFAQWCRLADTFSSASAPEIPHTLNAKIMTAITAHDLQKEHARGPFSVPAFALSFAMVILIVTAVVLVDTARIENQTITFSDIKSSQVQPQHQVVHFEFTATEARQVALVGDFNQWNTKQTLLTRKDARTWAVDLPLRKGAYQYLFYVDGQIWHTDPQRTDLIPDGFGGYNSVVEL